MLICYSALLRSFGDAHEHQIIKLPINLICNITTSSSVQFAF